MMKVDLKILIPLIFVSVVSCGLVGCTSASGSLSKTISQSPSDSNADELIEALVSKYPPHTSNGGVPDVNDIFGEGDRRVAPEDEDAARVRRVREQLRELGLQVFDALVASTDDGRHSYSDIFAEIRHLSVGDACFMIIESHVDFHGTGYKSRDGGERRHASKPSYLRRLRERKRLGQWWADRRGTTLRELQIESLAWTIAQEQAVGFTDDGQRVRILMPLEERLAELHEQSP